MTFLQDLIVNLDVHLPWLVPTLETLELAVELDVASPSGIHGASRCPFFKTS